MTDSEVNKKDLPLSDPAPEEISQENMPLQEKAPKIKMDCSTCRYTKAGSIEIDICPKRKVDISKKNQKNCEYWRVPLEV